MEGSYKYMNPNSISSLVQHWRKLSGAIHLDDLSVFTSHQHSFNLDFPPPAYIGDIENAPVVLLDANGGYDPSITPMEFSKSGFLEKYIELLRSPKAVDPVEISPYYAKRNYASLIKSDRLALVNAVAYRSSSISRPEDAANRRIVEKLPSTQVHRIWLRNELIPAAKAGKRLIVAHRNSLWNFKKKEGPIHGVIFTTNAVSADLSKDALAKISAFINGQAWK